MGYENFSRYYDLLTENISYKDRAKYFGKILAANGVSDGIVVDLACGTGSLSFELAKQGYEVIGVDGSAEMLSIAVAKNSVEKEDVLFLNQEMQSLDLYGSVRAMVSALDSINHVVDMGQLKKAFKKISAFLEPNGIFIFDVNSEYKHREVLGDNSFVYDCDEVYCVWQNTQKKNNIVSIELDFFERVNDVYKKSESSFYERFYSDDELTKLIDGAGLSVIAKYGDDTLKLPTDTTQRLVYVTKKRG